MKWSRALVSIAAVVILGGCETSLLIHTDPPGANLMLTRSDVYGVSDEQVDVPDRVFRNGSVHEDNLRLAMDGYHDLEVPVSLRKGRANQFSPPLFELDPITTTLEILTEPEHAAVEDITPGGFGYLGETPLTHSFDWEDLQKWAEVVEVRRGDHSFQAMKLDLRIERMGYGAVIVKDLLVPVGERRAFKRTLHPESEITFTSEPYGVTVFVMRRDNGVEYMKRLGTTPFPYTEGEVPLEHGETLYWEKTGYQAEGTPYVAGNHAFHAVLTKD